ncbi:unnamed protein product [Ectocarpus sp. 12 AP-2014]
MSYSVVCIAHVVIVGSVVRRRSVVMSGVCSFPYLRANGLLPLRRGWGVGLMVVAVFFSSFLSLMPDDFLPSPFTPLDAVIIASCCCALRKRCARRVACGRSHANDCMLISKNELCGVHTDMHNIFRFFSHSPCRVCK